MIVASVALHLKNSIDAQSFFTTMCTQHASSMVMIALIFMCDFLLCIYRGQSVGQMMNGIHKVSRISQARRLTEIIKHFMKLWLHGFVSRWLGQPLLWVCVLFWLALNQIIAPLNPLKFSLIDPEGSYLLMMFLLKIIGMALLLSSLFLPIGLGFMLGALPTWYDQLLGVRVVKT